MGLIKKMDRMLVKSFIAPFVLAFFIAIFVLVMQFLWNFIDEIIGKGVSTLDLFELLFYRSLSLFPLALPIGILLASVMVFGNLSEKYELSSLKSAGISLLRIMAPVIVLGGFVALFSIYCSNTLIPLSNLKFQSRLYDIRNQKPALSIEEGVFNDDFRGFTIRIGKKHKDNRRIEDILIYDQSSSSKRQYNMLIAKRGEMYISDDGRDFVMKLYDGTQYQDLRRTMNSNGLPFAKTKFDVYTKQFDLSEFELNYTDEDLFKSHHSMKSVGQLLFEIDTIEVQYKSTLQRAYYDFTRILNNKTKAGVAPRDTTKEKYGLAQMKAAARRPLDRNMDTAAVTTAKIVASTSASKGSSKKPIHHSSLLRVMDTIPAGTDWSDLFHAVPLSTQKYYVRNAISRAKSLRDNDRRLITSLGMISVNKAMHIFELHWKFSIATICIIFLLIGAPMGAIVRKGGYGYPLLVAITFFTVFIILNLMFKKLAETESMHAALAAWAPCIIMFPLSALLTYKALNDSKVLDVDKYLNPIYKLVRRDGVKAQE